MITVGHDRFLKLLTGEKVRLRRLEAGDLDFLYRWENEPEVWQWGDCGADDSGCAVVPMSAPVYRISDTPACRDDVALPRIPYAPNISPERFSRDDVTLPRIPLDRPYAPDIFFERFSRDELREFIENQQHDIAVTGQLRLVICRHEPPSTCTGRTSPTQTAYTLDTSDGPNSPIGFIDLFDLDPERHSAGVGILICDPANRGVGYGREALALALNYAQQTLGLRELWCTTAADNFASIALFEGAGFELDSTSNSGSNFRSNFGLIPNSAANSTSNFGSNFAAEPTYKKNS